MDMDKSLTLIANPGSSSRKYALYSQYDRLASLYFERLNNRVVCTLERSGHRSEISIKANTMTNISEQIMPILQKENALKKGEHIKNIGLRIVAPSSFFLQDHVITDAVVHRLEELLHRAPLHIAATLSELKALRTYFPDSQIIGISDSAFHADKPDYAWNYGLPLADADKFDIKRFGYHGISVASIVATLRKKGTLQAKLIVCHLGSGASITAVLDGKSVDTTMGYSPLEGVIMATRSGTIDPTAVNALKQALGLDDAQMETYLNTKGGLAGLGGSSDLPELLSREVDGDHLARLAIQTYVFSIQKAIGQMAAALDGVDMLVFTGTVGERSAPIRHLIAEKLQYLGLLIDEQASSLIIKSPTSEVSISKATSPRLLSIVPTNEADEMLRRVYAK
jgi:acetate kinase